MADFFWFSDSQWSRIEPLLPVNGKGARRVDDRRVLPGFLEFPMANHGKEPPEEGLWRIARRLLGRRHT